MPNKPLLRENCLMQLVLLGQYFLFLVIFFHLTNDHDWLVAQLQWICEHFLRSFSKNWAIRKELYFFLNLSCVWVRHHFLFDTTEQLMGFQFSSAGYCWEQHWKSSPLLKGTRDCLLQLSLTLHSLSLYCTAETGRSIHCASRLCASNEFKCESPTYNLGLLITQCTVSPPSLCRVWFHASRFINQAVLSCQMLIDLI